MEHLLAQNCYQRFLFVRGLPNNADSLIREKIFRAVLHRHQRLAQAELITGGFNGDVVYQEILTRLVTQRPPRRPWQPASPLTLVGK